VAKHNEAVHASMSKQAKEIRSDVKLDDTTKLEAAETKEMNKSLHCYICKENGHTKGQCKLRRCWFCPDETGHTSFECPKRGTKDDPVIMAEKERKRRQAYDKKKIKRREDAEAKLREAAGVHGFKALYKVLDLPTNKLASEADIKQAFKRLSLIYHPDKHQELPEEEQVKIADKFIDIRQAYELLLEGIRTGGKGMKGAVFKAGELTSAAGEGYVPEPAP